MKGGKGEGERNGWLQYGELGERVAFSLEIWWGTASDRSQGVKSWRSMLGYLGGCAKVTVGVGAGLLGTALVLRIV